MLYSATGTISGGTLAILWRGKPISLDDLIGKYCKSMIDRNLSDMVLGLIQSFSWAATVIDDSC